MAAYLQLHGYTIPQSTEIEGQHNAVRGRFNSGRAPDRAALVSRDGYSQILVFWSGSLANVTRLNRRPDVHYLQVVGANKIGYSRAISVVGEQNINEHYRRYGGPKPPPIQHDAIDDAFLGKASGVHYFDGKRWHALQGAD